MKLLEERILRDGKVYPGEVLKVGGFLNHLIDDGLLEEIGKEIYAHFRDKNVNKLITIEASGIAIACYAARHFHAPVLFAKKSKTANISSDRRSSVTLTAASARSLSKRNISAKATGCS